MIIFFLNLNKMKIWGKKKGEYFKIIEDIYLFCFLVRGLHWPTELGGHVGGCCSLSLSLTLSLSDSIQSIWFSHTADFLPPSRHLLASSTFHPLSISPLQCILPRPHVCYWSLFSLRFLELIMFLSLLFGVPIQFQLACCMIFFFILPIFCLCACVFRDFFARFGVDLISVDWRSTVFFWDHDDHQKKL